MFTPVHKIAPRPDRTKVFDITSDSKNDPLFIPNQQLGIFTKKLRLIRSHYKFVLPTNKISFEFRFHYCQSKSKYQQMDCVMSLQLFGDKNMTKEFTFRQPTAPTREEPLIIIKENLSDVGELLAVAIGHRNKSGDLQDIYISSFTVTNLESSRKWTIPCFNWLSVHIGDKSLYRHLWAFPKESTDSYLDIPVKFKYGSVTELKINHRNQLIYQIRFDSGMKWRIFRSNHDFQKIGRWLESTFPDSSVPHIPEKLSDNLSQSEENRLLFKTWTREVISRPEIFNSSKMRAFLGIPPNSMRQSEKGRKLDFGSQAQVKEVGKVKSPSSNLNSSGTTMESLTIVIPKRKGLRNSLTHLRSRSPSPRNLRKSLGHSPRKSPRNLSSRSPSPRISPR